MKGEPKLQTIVIVNDFAYVNGGAGQVAVTTAIEVSNQGYDVVYFSSVGPNDEVLLNKKIKLVCLNQKDILNEPNRLKAAVQGIWNYHAYREFSKLLDTLDKEKTIIHFHTISKAISSSVIRVAVNKGFRIVFHMHDYGLICPNMGLYDYKKKHICEIKPMSFKCFCTNCDARRYSHKLWRSTRQFIQSSVGGVKEDIKNIITVSNFSRDIVSKYFNQNTNFYTLYNPISVTKGYRSTPENNDYYVFVGRLSQEKDPLFIAEVAKRLNIKIIFVGDGELRGDIQSIYPKAKITGWITRDKVLDCMKKSRGLIMSSRCYETHGLVVSEAAALGIPSIVPHTCAATEFVKDNITGLIYEAGKHESLIDKVLIMNNNIKLKEMSEHVYDNYWSNPLTTERYIKQLLNIYHDVMGYSSSRSTSI